MANHRVNRRRFLTQTLGASVLGLRASAVGSICSDGEVREPSRECGEEGVPADFLDGSAEATRWWERNVGPAIGRITGRPSREIARSPFSVGLETLDRSMYDPQRVYRPLGELGVKWARLQTGWARCETSPGVYDFGWLESVVDAVRAEGVTPWFNLGYGNRLYIPEAPDVSAVGWIPVYNPEAQRAWLRFVGALAAHFRDRVKHWEIWNEPNIKNFWKPGEPSPELYCRFVAATSAVLRQIIPEVVIIGGALAGMPIDYLRQLLAHGILDHVDKVSYHPYRPVPEEGYRETLETWRTLLRQSSPTGKPVPLWQGENGCPSQPASAGALSEYDWTETRQAKWLLRRMLYDRVLEVELTSYFHMVDLVNYNWGTGPSGKTNFKGLLRGENYSPKPAYYAYQRVCALFDGETRRETSLDAMLTVSNVSAPPKVDSPANGIASRVERYVMAGFLRKNRPLWVLWSVDPPHKPGPIRRGKLQVNGAPQIDFPVLIDLLSGHVFRIDRRMGDFKAWTIASLPIPDYPVVIGDLEAIHDLVISPPQQKG
ncbi:hypothetical protein [Thermogutta sp.]|uniref:GH39 family glycosyl hydrolase n=1 Tax=Thermogutta sp. TaxID=1962930 RepID=UPI00321FB90B